MECLPVSTIPEGADWTYEIKLYRYRLEVVKEKGKITLYSRRRNILNEKFGYIAEALEDLQDGTVLDGELVALNAEGHADFNLLQNSDPSTQ
jgi:bifunctional non-homologous end joining protein LigD